MENELGRRRVLVMAVGAQGHINPTLQLAKRLTRHRLDVTFATSLSVKYRMAQLPNFPHISFAFFSDGHDGGFKPQHLQKSNSTYFSDLERLGSKAITDLITKNAEQGRPFACVVHPALLPWVATVARALHLPSVFLWIQPATVFALYYHYFHGYRDTIQSCFHDPLTKIQLPGLPSLTSLDLPSFLNSSDVHDLATPLLRRHFEMLLDQHSDPTVLVNTFEELESQAVRAIQGIQLRPIGPLIPSVFLDGDDPSDSCFGGDIIGSNCKSDEDDYVYWLNSKPRGSVVYVSFGSFASLSNQQKEEVGRGLLSFGRPFLWVIRDFNPHDSKQDSFSCREEVEEKGKIVSWCSQLKVLSSPATGCFLTHSGWNSSLESLACGVPVVMFPQWSDQGTNAKIVGESSRTGEKLAVGEDGVVNREEIERCLEVVMGDSKEGEEIRNNAVKWKKLAKEATSPGGSSYSNLNTFVDKVCVLET